MPPLHPYLSAGRAREGSVKCDVATFRRPRFEVTQNVDKLFVLGVRALFVMACNRCNLESLTDVLKLYEVFV